MPEALKVGDMVKVVRRLPDRGTVKEIRAPMVKVKIARGRGFITKCFMASELEKV